MSKGAILLHAPAEILELDRGPAHYALGLAAAFKAHLSALVLQLYASHPVPYGEALGAMNLEVDVEERNRNALKRAEAMRQHAYALGVEAEVLTSHSHAYTVPHIVADRARLCDFSVVGVSQTGLLSERAIAEYVLFQSGRPIIVVPQRFETPFSCERVLVAWDFERTAARALSDALPILRRATEVTLLTVDADKSIDTSLTSTQVLTALERRGITARFEKIERRAGSVGDAIQEHALERGCHLVVMGGYGHSRFRDFILGGATRRVLASPELPTLLAH